MRHLLVLTALGCGGPGTPPAGGFPTLDKTPAAVPQLVDTELPGMRLSVPAWAVVQKDEASAGGVFRVERTGSGAPEQIQVGWVQILENTQTDDGFLKATLDGLASAGVRVTKVGSRAATVHGHQGTTHELRLTDHDAGAFVTRWYCAADKREIQIRSMKVTAATHDKVIESVKCHTGTGGKTVERFAKFDAPGATNLAQQPDKVVFGVAGGAVILMAGIPGAIGAAIVEDSPAGREGRARMLKGWSPTTGAAPQFDHFSEGGRHHVSIGLVVETLPSIGVMTFVHCPTLQTTYTAVFVGPDTTPRADVVKVLAHVTCP